MKNRLYHLIIALAILILAPLRMFGQQSGDKQPDTTNLKITTESLRLQFNSEEILQMQNSFRQLQRSMGQIRTYDLENLVAPALIFHPFPSDLHPTPPDQHPDWEIPFGIELPDNEENIAYLSIPELASLIKYRKISSEQLTMIYLDRLKRYDNELHCVITLTEAHALQLARKADRELSQGIYRGILHGIPYGVKDLLAHPDYPTTWGAKPYEDQIIPQTATVIKKLEEAGAIMVAKLSLGALAMGDVWFGETTRNPWNTEQGSSGSSAGPAATVSAGLVAFAIGSETLGSIVSPSTRCAVTGLRPGFGRVSKYGAMALSWSMDKLGPICRNARDCAIVFDHIFGEDPKDASVIPGGFSYPEELSLDTLQIGYLEGLFQSEYTYKENDQQALEVFRELGAHLVPVELPDSFPTGALRIILNAEAAAAFDQLTLSNRDSLLVSQSPWSWPNTFRTARLIPAVEYINANRIRTKLVEEVNELLSRYDVIICPSFAGNQLTLTNLTGHPALLLPTGFKDEQTPTSITLIGHHFSEGMLTAVGQLYQDKTGLHLRRPQKFN